MTPAKIPFWNFDLTWIFNCVIYRLFKEFYVFISYLRLSISLFQLLIVCKVLQVKFVFPYANFSLALDLSIEINVSTSTYNELIKGSFLTKELFFKSYFVHLSIDEKIKSKYWLNILVLPSSIFRKSYKGKPWKILKRYTSSLTYKAGFDNKVVWKW